MEVDKRAVNVNALVKQRSADIQQIFKAFKAGKGTSTPMQKLPRHMRRRAMSHNVKRMPRNWRSYASKMTKRTKHRAKPLSRYYRRRRTFRGEDGHLLRTHRWHAKRYHMEKMFGTVLPVKCFQKVQRTCLRFAGKEACIVDHSYFKTFSVEYHTVVEAEKIVDQISALSHRPQSKLNFSYNRCYGLNFYKAKEDLPRNCLGPVQVRKCNDFFEFSMHPAVVPGFLEIWKGQAPVEKTEASRFTLYGPKSLQKLIETFQLKKSADPENNFNDVLDGAILLGGVWFSVVGKLQNANLTTKDLPMEIIYRSAAPHVVLDLVVAKQQSYAVWLKLVHSRIRVLGRNDELNVRMLFDKMSFPDDTADFYDSTFFEAETQRLQDKHNRRPTNRRVNYERLSPESPFSFEWKNIGDDLVPVKITPIGKGVPSRFGFIYSDVEPEVEESDEEPPPKMLLYSNPNEPGEFMRFVPMSRLFETEPPKKLSKGMKRRLKKKQEKSNPTLTEKQPVKSRIQQGTVIGRIVRGLRWLDHAGFGYCSRAQLQPVLANTRRLFFRNPESHRYREAIVSVVDADCRF